jgi:hypothetical protein
VVILPGQGCRAVFAVGLFDLAEHCRGHSS